MKDNIKQIILIISICIIIFIIGHVSGLYFGFPNNITLDYGDNMVKVTDNLKTLYNSSIIINNTNCPDCNCDCMIRDLDGLVCIDSNKYTVTKKSDLLALK